MMTVFLLEWINRFMELIIQARLVTVRNNTISEWLLIREQLKTGVAFEFCHDVARATYR